ncbi:hypothetical protein AHAS_Ahas01G0192600 [Arachis hypogaea]
MLDKILFINVNTVKHGCGLEKGLLNPNSRPNQSFHYVVWKERLSFLYFLCLLMSSFSFILEEIKEVFIS